MIDYTRHVVVPLLDIVAALEGTAANTDTDPRWRAANELRRLDGWEGRVLVLKMAQTSVTIGPRQLPEEEL